MLSRIIQYFKTSCFTRQCKKTQREWEKTIDVPKETEFCSLLYRNCHETNNKDTNCFASKAPGCPAYISYIKLQIQNKNPRAHVTKKDALEYIAKQDQLQ